MGGKLPFSGSLFGKPVDPTKEEMREVSTEHTTKLAALQIKVQ
jgi:hypothetical protein